MKEMPVGTGINCKAKLTFFGIFAKTPMEEETFVNVLKRKAEKMDAEFVEYNASLGKWIIRVSHI